MRELALWIGVWNKRLERPAPDGEVIGIRDGNLSPHASRQRTGVEAAVAVSFQNS